MLCVHLQMHEAHQRHCACAHLHSMVSSSVKGHTRRPGIGPAGKKIASAIKDISFPVGHVSDWHASCEPGRTDAVDSSKKNLSGSGRRAARRPAFTDCATSCPANPAGILSGGDNETMHE